MSGKIVVLLLCLSVAIFLSPLPSMDIVSGHEAREGMRLRTMVTTSTWLFPEVVRKPPLYYWISGLIAKLRGGIVDPLSLRLPSGLFAGGGVLVVLWLGKYAAPYAGSAIAALILLTSPLYIQQAHSSRTDMVLCFWVTCCLLVFFSATTRAQERVRDTRLWPSLFACLLALALLSKGPIGVVLVLLPISGFVLWQRDFSPVLPLVRPGPALAFGVLGLGWYLGAFWGAGEEFWDTQIRQENLSRFFGGIDTMPPFYYVVPLLTMFAPWSLLLPFALWRAFKQREEGPLFLALWWATVVLVFQTAAYKRARYLLPAQPATALLVGWWCATRESFITLQVQSWKWWKPSVLLVAVATGVLIVAGFAFLWGIPAAGPLSYASFPAFLSTENQQAVAEYCQWVHTHRWGSVAWWGVFALSAFFLCRALVQVSLRAALIALFCLLLLIYTTLYPSWLVVTSRLGSPQTYVSHILEKIEPGARLILLTPCAEKGFPVVFTLQNQVPVAEVQWPWGSPPPLTTGYYLVSEERQSPLLSSTAGQWVEVVHDTRAVHWPLVLLYYTAPS